MQRLKDFIISKYNKLILWINSIIYRKSIRILGGVYRNFPALSAPTFETYRAAKIILFKLRNARLSGEAYGQIQYLTMRIGQFEVHNMGLYSLKKYQKEINSFINSSNHNGEPYDDRKYFKGNFDDEII